MSLHQPLAVIGIGVCFPFAASFTELKTRLKSPDEIEVSLMKWGNHPHAIAGHQFSELAFDYKKFGIPPIFRQAVSTETLLALMAVDDALADLDRSSWDLDRTDCFCGTSFGNDAIYRNAAKVAAIKAKAEMLVSSESSEPSTSQPSISKPSISKPCTSKAWRDQQEQAVDEFKRLVSQQFTATSHDRVGEMASSVPARIAHYLGSRGKCMTLDSLDLSGIRLLQTADDSFRYADSSIAILTTFQRFHRPFLATLLQQQGKRQGVGMSDIGSQAMPLCEGATTLVVRPLAEARAAGNPILAVFNTLDVAPNGAADPDASSSGFGYGLANQVFQHIVETVAMPSSSSSIVAGQSLSGERWRLSFTGDVGTFIGDVGAFTGNVGDDVGSRMRSANMADDTADYMPGEREDKECLGSVVQTKSTATAEPIAIVGYQSMAAQCGDNDAIWRAIVDGQDYISPLADDRLSPTAFLRIGSPAKLSTYSAHGAAMVNTEALDQRLPYPVMPAKRMRMDPVQKLAQICATDALAGISLPQRSAVVVGSNLSLSLERELATQDSWAHVHQCDPTLPRPDVPSMNQFSFDGCSASGIARGISQRFQLNAECLAVEAACASSLAALHYAVKALQSGRIEMAVCGGVEFAANERDMVLCCAQMMLSKNKIAPFSADADGFTPGDGGAFFVLKRLTDAQAAGEPILGIIHSISGSCDAKSMTAPDREGQVLAMQKTLAHCTISPDMVQYIEAHGTGTVLGDKTEMESIADCYSHASRTTPLVVGSVKYNFGHCFAGAGAMALNKVLLSFDHQVLAPTPPRGEYNTALPTAKIPARILSCAEPWPAGAHDSRFAALNSFGTGGINYHVILEQGQPYDHRHS